MPILFGEKPDSRSGTDSPLSQTRLYFCGGTTDAVAVQFLAESSIPTYSLTSKGTLKRQSIRYDWRGPKCDIEATFGKSDGSMRWSFDATGGTVTVKGSKQTVGKYWPEGEAEPPNHANAIGVNGDEIEGCEKIIPAMKFSVSITHPAAVLNLERAFQLGDAVGSTNNDIFFTKPAGTFLYLGSTGSDGSEVEAECTYNYAYSRNLVNEVIAGITVAQKKGWDHAWIEWKKAVTGGGPHPKAKAIRVERIYDPTNFGTLFGFS